MKIPAITPTTIKTLLSIRDALRRANYLEVFRHIDDIKTKIKLEQDWCLNSDPQLQDLYNYFLNLETCIKNIISINSCVNPIKQTIIEEITQFYHTLEKISNNAELHSAP